MSKWDRRLAELRRSTDKTDKTLVGAGVLSVLSVDQPVEKPPIASFVSFVGKSPPTEIAREASGGDALGASDTQRSTDKTDKTPSIAAQPVPSDRDRKTFCAAHNRPLTYDETQAGRCNWCHPEDRQWSESQLAALRQINAPRPAPAPLPCQRCGQLLPPDRWSLCLSCFDVEYPE